MPIPIELSNVGFNRRRQSATSFPGSLFFISLEGREETLGTRLEKPNFP